MVEFESGDGFFISPSFFDRPHSSIHYEVTAIMDCLTSLICVAALVFFLISLWKLFVKMGLPGWYALIPVFNLYTVMKYGWSQKAAKTNLILYIIGYILMCGGFIGFVLGFKNPNIFRSFGNVSYQTLMEIWSHMTTVSLVFLIIAFVGCLLALFSEIMFMVGYVKLAQQFGKQGWFLVGTFFCPVIFIGILAFGKSYYLPLGKQAESLNPIRFCWHCGTKVNPGARFCRMCGAELNHTMQAVTPVVQPISSPEPIASMESIDVPVDESVDESVDEPITDTSKSIGQIVQDAMTKLEASEGVVESNIPSDKDICMEYWTSDATRKAIAEKYGMTEGQFAYKLKKYKEYKPTNA